MEKKKQPETNEPAESKSETFYTLGEWAGMIQHRCALCPWDTLEGEAAMLEHLRVVHLPPPEPPRTIIPVYDRYGNLKNGE